MYFHYQSTCLLLENKLITKTGGETFRLTFPAQPRPRRQQSVRRRVVGVIKIWLVGFLRGAFRPTSLAEFRPVGLATVFVFLCQQQATRIAYFASNCWWLEVYDILTRARTIYPYSCKVLYQLVGWHRRCLVSSFLSLRKHWHLRFIQLDSLTVSFAIHTKLDTCTK